MTKLPLIFLLFFGTMIVSCHNASDADTDLTLRFLLTYDGNPLASFDELEFSGHQKVFFTKYSFYLSDIKLVANEGENLLSPVEFIDLLTGIDSWAKAKLGVSRIYSEVPAGLYKGVTFNIGLNDNVNATDPSQYTNTQALGNSGEYWIGWSSYIFNKLEGKLDHNGDGLFETNIAIHIGSNQAFRSVVIDTSFALREGKGELVIGIDLKEVLTIKNQHFDLHETHQVHSIEQLPKALLILDNCVDKFKLSKVD